MLRPILSRGAALLTALGLCLSLTACQKAPPEPTSSGPASGIQPENLLAELSANIDCPPLTQSQQEVFTDFGLRLIRTAAVRGENTQLSPLSVLTALAMTANGADKDTLSQMEQVLGMEVPELNCALHSYWNSLPQSEGGVLLPGNSIWFTSDPRFTVQQSFLKTSASYFNAQIFQVPFDEAQTCEAINALVSQQTNGMIPTILDDIPPDAIMYLINALAFEGDWPEPYQSDQVQPGAFTAADGTTETVDYLHTTDHLYLEHPLATGFLKPYKGGQYAFAALLPQAGHSIEELLTALDGKQLHTLLSSPKDCPVNTVIPKFQVEYGAELSKFLCAMGMPDAFGHQADFSRLGQSTAGDIYISRVLHNTFLSLGEQGTRAGAVTVVEMKDESAPSQDEQKSVTLDRSFVYLLLDMDSRIPFFMGVFSGPSAQQSEPDPPFPPLQPASQKPTIMVDGQLYYDTGRDTPHTGPRCGTMDGTITSSVDSDQVPTVNDQSNFGTGYGYQRWEEDTIEVLIQDQWRVFQTESEFKICGSAIPDWGITLNAQNVTPSGMTLTCTQSGGELLQGTLQTGTPFSISKLENGHWHPVEPLQKDICWTMEAWNIPCEDTISWTINWEQIYGILPPGTYQMEKTIMDYHSPGNYEEQTHYAEFTIT